MKKILPFAFCLIPVTLAAIAPTDNTTILLAQRKPKPCGDTADPRGPLDPLIPYVIGPRRTLLLSDKPKLRWNAVPGATRYTASIIKGADVVWETQLSATEVVYPGAVPLKPGIDYQLVVKADNGRTSEEEKLPERGFKLLALDEAKVVQTAIAQLQEPTTDKAKTLLKVYLYSGSDLRAEAIEALEALSKSGVKDATVYRRLGSLYQQVGVTLLAEDSYLQAHKVAVAAKDVEGQAAVAVGLAEVYIDIGENRETIRWLTQARDSYKTLGNTQRVQELERQIAALKVAA